MRPLFADAFYFTAQINKQDQWHNEVRRVEAGFGEDVRLVTTHEVFLEALASGKPAAPTFRDGLATDYVTDAVLRSAKSGKWEQVPEAI